MSLEPPVPPRPDLPASGLPVAPAPYRAPSQDYVPPPQRERHGLLKTELLILAAVVATLVAVLAIRSPAGHPGEYRFLHRNADGTPYRWNPCEPIHYVTNMDLAPSGAALADVQQAVRRVSAATGIEFRYDGTSAELPADRSGPSDYVDEARRDPHWAPVLIAWIDRSEFEEIGGDSNDAGLAHPVFSRGVYVSGVIALPDEPAIPSGFAIGGGWGTILMHELGHIVGLDHVHSVAEIMDDTIWPGMTGWGPGDRTGLRKLGRDAGCLQTPSAAA